MPLLKKKVFEKRATPDFLRDEEEVFYCEITGEIFRDYEEFSERMFLCNSMIWTCSMTGKQNLTYQEALESEEHARQSLREFPYELKAPVLFVASKTHRTSFGDMAEDVFLYVKDRYFIGEHLEVSFTGNTFKNCHVKSVIAPSEDKLKGSPKNGNVQDRKFGPPASLYKYEIEHLDAEDSDISEIMIVDPTQLRRRKAQFNRDKCKLFLKQYVEQGERGVMAIKESILEKFGVNNLKWEHIFDGPLPTFEVSKKLEKPPRPPAKKKERQETLAKYLQKNGQATNKNADKKSNTNVNLLEQMKKREEEFKKHKQLREEEKLALKQKKKEDSMKLARYLREWYRPKEDLELEDQAKLPEPTPVNCKVPDKYLGDLIMVMEFVNAFRKLLSTKDFFPNGFTFELMERALTEKEVAGPLTDLIQMLLTAIFNVQDEESNQYRTAIENAKEINEDNLSENLSLTDATHLATLASSWSNKYQGMPLSRLPLYSLTVSEILRLHLLSSGARINETGARWRYSQRGGYTSEDDPGLYLRLNQPHILKALALHNVVELPIGDKLKIISCLIDQLLTYADVRDEIEEKLDNVKQLKVELKSAQVAEKKREMEFVTSRFKIKKECKGEPQKRDELLQKLTSDNEKKQVENTRKIEKLIKAINKGQNIMGYDRAYRKYVRAESVPGFFVNVEEEHAGKCLDEPTKQYPKLVNGDKNVVHEYVMDLYEKLNTSDKENAPKSPTKSKSPVRSEPKSPSKINGLRSPVKAQKDVHNELLMCNADPETCVVHSEMKRLRWSFFHCEEQIDELINTLNKRGIRESELKEVLQNDKENILALISQTPVQLLNPEIKVKENVEEDQKTLRNAKKNKDRYEDANLGYPLDMQPENVLHSALLDNILEMEEKIYAGNLGALRVKNRDEWRSNLQNRKYDKLEKSIKRNENEKYWKHKKNEKNNGSRPPTPEIVSNVDEYQDPGRFLGTTVDIKSEKMDSDGEEVSLTLSESEKIAVKSLARSLAQVAHGIEPKYLKKPLGHADVTKSDLNNRKSEYDYLDKWEQSLLASTSFSQVFLHYGTLDSCVMWSRSALLARCRICRRQKDSENMLLCDQCNQGHHLYCLKPKLTAVPQGDWYCDRCKKEKEKEAKLLSPEPTPQKKRRIFREEDIDEEEEAADEEDSEEENSSSENSDSDEEMDLDDDVEETKDDLKMEICTTCGSGGELVSCDRCPSSYHIECCEPPLRRAPRGQWTCHNCRKEESQYVNGKNKGSSDSDSGDEVVQNRRSNRHEKGREDLPLHNAALQDLLADVMKQDDAWAFLKPVTKNEVPDYFEIVSNPMDFGTIKYKLNMGKYTEDMQLMNDAALIFSNCSLYNQTDSEVYRCGVRLMNHFVKKAKELGLKVPPEMDDEQPKSKKRRAK